MHFPKISAPQKRIKNLSDKSISRSQVTFHPINRLQWQDTVVRCREHCMAKHDGRTITVLIMSECSLSIILIHYPLRFWLWVSADYPLRMWLWVSAQSCPALCNFMDCSPPGSSAHGISRQEYWSGVPFTTPMNVINALIVPL